jgi:hypothetical protein
VFLALFIINSAVFMPVFSTTQNTQLAWISRTLLPFYGIFMILCGLAAGVVGLVAVIREHERLLAGVADDPARGVRALIAPGRIPGAALSKQVARDD